MDTVTRAIAELFGRQDGLATRDQMAALGAARGLIRGRVKSGEWLTVSRNVIGSAAMPMTWRRQVRAAWLDAGPDVAVSHATAGRLHGFDGLDRETSIHLTTCGRVHRTSLPGVRMHTSEILEPRACAEVLGMRVVPRPVALIQIAGTHGADAVGQAMDWMLREGDAPGWIEHVATKWHERGAKGAGVVLGALQERVGKRLPRSWFQRIAKRLLASRGIRTVDEHPIRDPVTDELLAELDLAIPELQIGVECQSWKWHGSPSSRARDALRKRRLRLLGWEIVDVWYADLRRIEGVVAEVEFLIDRKIPRLLA